MKTITVPTTLGPREAHVHHQEGGLAVTSDPTDIHLWTVTHLASGRSVAKGFMDPEHAAEAMEALLALGKWRRSMWELIEDTAFLEKAREVLAPFLGPNVVGH